MLFFLNSLWDWDKLDFFVALSSICESFLNSSDFTSAIGAVRQRTSALWALQFIFNSFISFFICVFSFLKLEIIFFIASWYIWLCSSFDLIKKNCKSWDKSNFSPSYIDKTTDFLSPLIIYFPFSISSIIFSYNCSKLIFLYFSFWLISSGVRLKKYKILSRSEVLRLINVRQLELRLIFK